MTERMSERFRAMHADGLFVMPNPWDIGSARFLAARGFKALATTSLGHAATLGRPDQAVTLDELVEHVAGITAAVDVPVNVDSERCFADDAAGIAATVHSLAAAGAAGCSIEDYDPATGAIDRIEIAAERVAAAAEAAQKSGLVLTARTENLRFGVLDLDDTLQRLRAYRDAGADVLYAPGFKNLDDIARCVKAVEAPMNVLALRDGPTISELAAVGVRRVSTGGALTRAAFGALDRAARELLETGTSDYIAEALTAAQLDEAFGATT